ncbi:hypothetical protein H0H92_015011 [Tricholoma furcatifolium]|nr:hypothetical protein H0H92_015011 [Tricholoma furcatifolium]
MKSFTALSLLTLCVPAFASIYLIEDAIIGPDFYNTFNFEAIADPTHGRVNYVNESQAIHENLTFASFDTFILRSDFKTVLDPDGPGRDSVRIRTNKNYTHHVAVTWPAIWETDEADWPNGGEIDIVEGVNNVVPNLSTLHTGANCTMPTEDRPELGAAQLVDCYGNDNGNTGCGVEMSTDLSYGIPFNENGGGWFAVERSSASIGIWFWPRNATNVPLEVRYGGLAVDPSLWGTRQAYFPSTSTCNIDEHFDGNNIIINLTFCGDWAGNVYPGTSGCPSTCIDYVNDNPSAFVDAYFDFASIRVYTQ